MNIVNRMSVILSLIFCVPGCRINATKTENSVIYNENIGVVAESENTVYYIDKFELYEKNNDNIKRIKECVSYVQCYNDDIFYVSYEKDNRNLQSLYRYNSNGKDELLINLPEGYYQKYIVNDGSFYYLKDKTLYKHELNSKSNISVRENVIDFIISGNKIYYLTINSKLDSISSLDDYFENMKEFEEIAIYEFKLFEYDAQLSKERVIYKNAHDDLNFYMTPVVNGIAFYDAGVESLYLYDGNLKKICDEQICCLLSKDEDLLYTTSNLELYSISILNGKKTLVKDNIMKVYGIVKQRAYVGNGEFVGITCGD